MIYIVTHKETDLPTGYTPLLVGEADADIALKVRDYCPLLSKMNVAYGETEALLFLRNYDKDDVKGIMTYRRYWTDTSIPEGYDGIACPIMVGSVYSQYCNCHCKEDIDLIDSILLDLYPDYSEAWNDYIVNGSELYYGGGYVLKASVFDAMVDWLFPILDEFRSRLGLLTMDDVYNRYKHTSRPAYQSRVLGFLSERLCTLWLKKNAKIMPKKYILDGVSI